MVNRKQILDSGYWLFGAAELLKQLVRGNKQSAEIIESVTETP